MSISAFEDKEIKSLVEDTVSKIKDAMPSPCGDSEGLSDKHFFQYGKMAYEYDYAKSFAESVDVFLGQYWSYVKEGHTEEANTQLYGIKSHSISAAAFFMRLAAAADYHSDGGEAK